MSPGLPLGKCLICKEKTIDNYRDSDSMLSKVRFTILEPTQKL